MARPPIWCRVIRPNTRRPLLKPNQHRRLRLWATRSGGHVFQDKELQNPIRTALNNDYDVRIAAMRVMRAQAQLGITRADQLPSLSVGGSETIRGRLSLHSQHLKARWGK